MSRRTVTIVEGVALAAVVVLLFAGETSAAAGALMLALAVDLGERAQEGFAKRRSTRRDGHPRE